MSFQTTLRESITAVGIGLHSGKPVTLTLHPAKADQGIVFRRIDVEKRHALVPARYDLVTDTRLGTTLTNAHGVSVSTVEHLMAALWGQGIDNATIDIDAPEVPIMDGSSEPFVALLARAGVKKQDSVRRIIRVLRDVEITDGDSIARVSPYDGDDYGCALDVTIEFAHSAIRVQRARYDFSATTFADALSRARTFCFEKDVQAMHAAGLARGGSLDNAVVIGDAGVLNAEGLRFNDEFVRHKALDCMGDLFLAGHRIEGMFQFVRPGHGVNNKLLRALLADGDAWKLVAAAPARPAIAHTEAVLAAL